MARPVVFLETAITLGQISTTMLPYRPKKTKAARCTSSILRENGRKTPASAPGTRPVAGQHHAKDQQKTPVLLCRKPGTTGPGWLAAERSEAPVLEPLGHRYAMPQPPSSLVFYKALPSLFSLVTVIWSVTAISSRKRETGYWGSRPATRPLRPASIRVRPNSLEMV